MSRERIVRIASGIVEGRIGIVEGSIAICRARPSLDDVDVQHDLLLPFIAFVSEIEDFPIGSERENWNKERLPELDARIRDIVSASEPEMLLACKKLLADWGQSISH